MNIWDERWSVPARTIDMLGRQQIANVPTALHELFKNAHDAYADHLVADFYRADRLLVVRDDGDGMTREQLRQGWLTLASSAKRNANEREDYPGDSDRRPRRAIMGEKGIGRLAIASIGPQVLIMTRARSPDGAPSPLHVSLVHWGVNQLPDVDLSRIVIPTARHDGEGLPSADTIRALSARLGSSVEEMRSLSNTTDIDRILADIRSFDIDPALDFPGLGPPSLEHGGCGTHFLIRPTEETLVFDLTPPNDEEVSPVQKYLLGFSNTMMPDRPPPSITAVFNDHREDGTVVTPIGDDAFFTPGEFRSADHSIEGEFDRFGHFKGRISVYRQEPRDHEIAWRNATGAATRCGPFRITFAYLQGRVGESRLPPEEWSAMSTKLNRIGGLYVYRNGIRILPYGGPDQDFVGIERRRTKSAQDWFFSYRRMFGAVEITHEENSRLKEKAGREGFIRDGAYNDFVAILSSFFENLAIDFFRDSSRHGEWSETKKRLTREAELIAKRNKSARAKIARFARDLDTFFGRLENGAFAADAISVETEISARIASLPPDRVAAGAAVLAMERDFHQKLAALDNGLTIAKPRGAGLSKAKAADWESYGQNASRIRSELLGPLRERVEAALGQVVAERDLPMDRRRRAAAILDDKGERAVSDAGRLRRRVDVRLEELRSGVTRAVKDAVVDLSAKVEKSMVEILSGDEELSGDGGLELVQAKLEETIDVSAAETRSLLESLADQLASLMEAVSRGETLDETTDAIESQSHAYREQLDQYVELAQLGTAVGIVQHEFSSTITRVRTTIGQLGAWARDNPALRDLERNLRDGFEHLDAYLDNFAPLSKRLSKTQVQISGKEIRTYLAEVFEDRMLRHGVSMEVEEGFDGRSLDGQPSAILAAFVNVVDNALHWVTTVPAGSRWIKLGIDGDGLSIVNSGPGIEARIADRIFSYGETTRAGGRGMGLYVSRAALLRSGLELTLLDIGANRQPRFKIAPIADEERANP